MTTEKAIEILSDVGDINRCCTEDAEALDMAIKALEAQSCEDCISREAVDEYIINLLSGYLYDEERTRLEDLTAFVWELPSVQPTRPKGKWIEVFVETPNDPYSHGFKSHKCSKCGHRPLQILNYCPKCGAIMGESEE